MTNSSPNSPYNQALGQTLIERSIRERIVLVGVTLNGKTEEETEASLDELSLLIDTAGADEAGRLTQKRDVPDHTWFVGKGKAEVAGWVAVVKPGTVLYEIGGVEEDGRRHGHRFDLCPRCALCELSVEHRLRSVS